MSHDLERQENGTYSYVGRQAAWHNLGTVTDKLMTYEEIKQYCLNWKAYTAPLFSEQGIKTPFYGVFRDDNNECLGTCSSKYTPIHHDLGFQMVSALLGKEDCFETAGVLGRGEKVWGLGILPESRLGDDLTQNYLLFMKSYDLTTPNIFKIVRTRVVCQNTLSASLRELTSMVSVRNTKKGEVFLKDRIKAMQNIHKTIAQLDANNVLLANKLSTPQIEQKVFLDLFPLTPKFDEQRQEKVMVSPTRRNNIIDRIQTCITDNDDNAFPEQRGTLYNLLNGITEYVDHFRGSREEDEDDSNEDKGALSAMFGTGDALKAKAYNIIIDLAKDAQDKYAPIYSLPAVKQVEQDNGQLLLTYQPE